MSARRLSRATHFVMIGLMILLWAGSMPYQTDAVPSFVETTHPDEQGAAVNTGMDAYDPRVLRITFSDSSPAEPLPATPEGPMTAVPQAAETQPDNLFTLRVPTGEPSQQPASQETPAVTQTAVSAPAVPEPSSLLLLLSGVVGVAGCRYARRRRSRVRHPQKES